MPRKVADDDEMPRRRRRGAQAVAIEAEEERGLLMRVLLHSPKDTVAGVLAAGTVIAIITNALFLQAGRHPSPMFGSVVTLPPPAPAVTSPLPRPRPVEAARPVESQAVEAKPAEPAKPSESRVEPRPSDSKTSDSRTSDPMTNLVVKSTSAPPAPANVVRPPAPIPSRGETTQSAASKRIAAVQRALTEYGYGQLKPTGTIGSDTQAAIAKFERDRKLPVTGQMSDRVVRELSAMIGHPVE
ncbi:peptidoglycan-binding domain-containing protein [Bradyrhizobium cenepequi]|uniref:peptidoglycan-binding domain-containing protein n=1 Tax=Bradyrhizobium cenepequi TaxID=2821403 RepID=UPI001CE2CF7F|nr:peptidoglycan-binding domain-containing protein [Bradyrhizobium cenepequi]MCA6110225.1 peptidoglycan-binding protein [Bradyrhizobium cenepequi]